MQKNKESKIGYKKPTVLAATKANKNFSASCMGGNANCLHCRKS